MNSENNPSADRDQTTTILSLSDIAPLAFKPKTKKKKEAPAEPAKAPVETPVQEQARQERVEHAILAAAAAEIKILCDALHKTEIEPVPTPVTTPATEPVVEKKKRKPRTLKPEATSEVKPEAAPVVEEKSAEVIVSVAQVPSEPTPEPTPAVTVDITTEEEVPLPPTAEKSAEKIEQYTLPFDPPLPPVPADEPAPKEPKKKRKSKKKTLTTQEWLDQELDKKHEAATAMEQDARKVYPPLPPCAFEEHLRKHAINLDNIREQLATAEGEVLLNFIKDFIWKHMDEDRQNYWKLESQLAGIRPIDRLAETLMVYCGLSFVVVPSTQE